MKLSFPRQRSKNKESDTISTKALLGNESASDWVTHFSLAWSYNLIFFATLQLCCFTIDMRSYKLCLIFKLLSVTVAILPEILKSCHKGDCSREKMPQHGDPYASFISGSFPYLWKPISSISKKVNVLRFSFTSSTSCKYLIYVSSIFINFC